MGVFYKLLLFFLIVLLAFAGYYIYLNLPGEQKSFEVQGFFEEKLPESNASSQLVQFYPNMRFNHNDLSYQYLLDCSVDRKIKMSSAFNEVSVRTGILSFYETTSAPDIFISCSGESVREHQSTFVAGEGGPSKFFKLTPYSLIVEGEIVFNDDESSSDCENHVVELHELLHVLGYDHISDKDSVLYPYFSCKQKMSEEIVEDLIRVYSVDAKAELSLKEIGASKSGRYLNFDVSIENSGLIGAVSVELVVSSAGVEIKSFDMEEINFGSTKTLSIQNLKLPSRNTEEIKFEIVSSSAEYYLDNNFVELVVEE